MTLSGVECHNRPDAKQRVCSGSDFVYGENRSYRNYGVTIERISTAHSRNPRRVGRSFWSLVGIYRLTIEHTFFERHEIIFIVLTAHKECALHRSRGVYTVYKVASIFHSQYIFSDVALS
jgi:hypothetical protein